MTDTKHIETLRHMLSDYHENTTFSLERAALQAAIAALQQAEGREADRRRPRPVHGLRRA